MEIVDERKFTVVDGAEMSTLAFLINEPEGDSNCATIQKLEYVLQDKSNNFKKTFYISNTNSQDEKDYNILLLSIGREKAFMNMAVLKKDELLVSKEPTNISYKTLRTAEAISYKDVSYTPNFKRPISIIDPEIADEVKPVLYFDEDSNMVKAKVKLLPAKSYIAIEVHKNSSGNFQTNYTICSFE